MKSISFYPPDLTSTFGGSTIRRRGGVRWYNRIKIKFVPFGQRERSSKYHLQPERSVVGRGLSENNIHFCSSTIRLKFTRRASIGGRDRRIPNRCGLRSTVLIRSYRTHSIAYNNNATGKTNEKHGLYHTTSSIHTNTHTNSLPPSIAIQQQLVNTCLNGFYCGKSIASHPSIYRRQRKQNQPAAKN